MKRSIFLLFFLASCFSDSSDGRIASLEKKLKSAEIAKEKTDEEIAQLIDQIRLAKLSLIRRRLNEFEANSLPIPEPSQLFLSEREALYEMIQSGAYIADAQVELDRILRMITEKSNSEI